MRGRVVSRGEGERRGLVAAVHPRRRGGTGRRRDPRAPTAPRSRRRGADRGTRATPPRAAGSRRRDRRPASRRARRRSAAWARPAMLRRDQRGRTERHEHRAIARAVRHGADVERERPVRRPREPRAEAAGEVPAGAGAAVRRVAAGERELHRADVVEERDADRGGEIWRRARGRGRSRPKPPSISSRVSGARTGDVALGDRARALALCPRDRLVRTPAPASIAWTCQRPSTPYSVFAATPVVPNVRRSTVIDTGAAVSSGDRPWRPRPGGSRSCRRA